MSTFAALALLTACTTAPKESFYTLSSIPFEPAPAAATFTIQVGPVTVPESVDRTPMVVRTGPNVVDIDDFHRWAEPLKTAIPRVLAENLMRELPGARASAGRAIGPPPDWKVAVEIQRLDSSFAEGATLDALWTATPAKGGAPRTGRSTIREPAASPDHAGIAAAHSRALGRLASEVAAAMR